MNAVQEIQAAVDDIVVMMAEKGIKEPDAGVNIRANARPYLSIKAHFKERTFDGRCHEFFYGKTLAECFDAARAYIAALPSPEETVTRTYLSKVADAVDYARENSIAEEYVAPLRGVSMAMTENLLTHEAAE